MAVSCRIQSKNIKIYRQGGSDNFYVSWALTSAQKKRKITRSVYNSSKKKKVSTTKKFPDVIASYTVKWYYKVVTGSSGRWYLDKTITGIGTGYSTTSHDLWSPPSEARQIKVTVRPIAKTYKTNSSGSTANWFSVDSTAKTDSDYDEYPQTPSIGEFTIKGKTLDATVIVNFTNFDSEEKTAVDLQVLRNESTMIRFDGSNAVETGDIYYVRKEFTSSDPMDQSGVIHFTNIELLTVGSYQIRARVASWDNNNEGKAVWYWSEYSSWSSSIDTRPNTPRTINVQAVAADQVKVTWSSVDNITRYEIEYASDNDGFDSGTFQSVTVEDATTHVVAGLEAGHRWYFRVRSVNDADRSDPSEIKSTLLATKPSPPTTWSSVNIASITANDREDVFLYWIHNSVDGSAQRMARFKFKIGDTYYYHKVENTKTDDYGELIDETLYVNLWNLDLHSEGEITEQNKVGTFYDIFKTKGVNEFEWKVATRGISTEYSDYSVERTIEVYEKPNLSLTVSDGKGVLSADTFTSFPLKISGAVTPASQTPISFHISIIAGDAYSTVDRFGEETLVVKGNEIYSHYIDASTLNHEIKAGDIYLEEDKSYKIEVTAYTNAGLNCVATRDFKTEWEMDEGEAQIDAVIEYNSTYRYATIRPFYSKYLGEDTDEEGLEDYEPKCYTGTSAPSISGTTGDMYFDQTTGNVYSYAGSGIWSLKSTFIFEDLVKWYSGTTINGEIESDIYSDSGITSAELNAYYFNTNTGDIFKCVKAGGSDVAIWKYIWNCFWEMTDNITDIELDVYRKEVGESFVKINEEGISNALQSSSEPIIVLDYHPSFGTCTYRIVATNTVTGLTVFEDIEEIIPETSVVIQWDEEWKDKKNKEEDEEEGEVFEGAVLVLPANIKLTDSNNIDVNFAEYIGRSRPVAYYGTQKGEKPSINCEFEKSDTDKLTLLRQLMNYNGNVYIREPSGLGYWANVVVSYNKNYKELTIPVTLSITPVEGGI